MLKNKSKSFLFNCRVIFLLVICLPVLASAQLIDTIEYTNDAILADLEARRRFEKEEAEYRKLWWPIFWIIVGGAILFIRYAIRYRDRQWELHSSDGFRKSHKRINLPSMDDAKGYYNDSGASGRW